MLKVRGSWAVEQNLLHTCGGGMDKSWAVGGYTRRAVGCGRNICTLGVVVLLSEEADGRDLFALLLVVFFRGSDAMLRHS